MDSFAAIKALRALMEKKVPQPAIQTPVDTPVDTPPQTTNIGDIVQLLPQTLSPVRGRDGEIIYDRAFVAAKCHHGHFHKYFLSDIAAGNVAACTTCGGGTVFMRLVRSVAETLLEAPFMLEGSEYVNPIMGVTIIPVKERGEDRIASNTIYIHHTTSANRVRTSLARLLYNHSGCAHLRTKLAIYLPKTPARTDEPPQLPVISRDVGARLCIDS